MRNRLEIVHYLNNIQNSDDLFSVCPFRLDSHISALEAKDIDSVGISVESTAVTDDSLLCLTDG